MTTRDKMPFFLAAVPPCLSSQFKLRNIVKAIPNAPIITENIAEFILLTY
jgi:hypothetical protein